MTHLAFIAPAVARNILLVLIGGGYIGYHLFHLWRRRRKRELKLRVEVEERKGVRVEGQLKDLPADAEGASERVPSPPQSDGTVGRGVPSAPQSSNNEAALSPDCGGQGTVRPAVPASPQPIRQSDNPPIRQSPSPLPPSSLSGEEEYVEARAIPHQPIPDFANDGEYLKLLVKSAELGYPRALAKLGEYAMRRGWTVEAYYWLWRAKKGGMPNLDRTMLLVRSAWASGGFRRESANEHEGFAHGQGTIGYALLCIDVRHNDEAARARLAECAPEFLKAIGWP